VCAFLPTVCPSFSLLHLKGKQTSLQKGKCTFEVSVPPIEENPLHQLWKISIKVIYIGIKYLWIHAFLDKSVYLITVESVVSFIVLMLCSKPPQVHFPKQPVFCWQARHWLGVAWSRIGLAPDCRLGIGNLCSLPYQTCLPDAYSQASINWTFLLITLAIISLHKVTQ
jgi:hypothetical protein